MVKWFQVFSVICVYSFENINNMSVVVLEDFGGDLLDNLVK